MAKKNQRKVMVLPFKSWFGFRDYAESKFLYFNVLLVGKRNIFKCLRLENKKRTFDEYRSLIGKKFKIKSDNVIFTGKNDWHDDPLVLLYMIGGFVEDDLFNEYFKDWIPAWKEIREANGYF